MSQTAITKAFEAWLVNKTVNGEPARPDKMVFALIPGQDENTEIDRNEGMPPAGRIRHTADITQYGALNENAVVYSVVLDTTVGNWAYNWVGLVDSATGTVLMIVHLAEQQKIKTENGQQGNSFIRNLAMEFDSAATASHINVTPATWMIDFSARLQSMDESRRLANVDYYGDAAFRGDGFKVTVAGATATIAAGLGYVAGLRAIMTNNQALALAGKTGVWVDICWQGTVTGAWANSFTLRAADTLTDYVDSAGNRHFVTRIATVNGSTVTDNRVPFPSNETVEQLDGRFLQQSKNLSDVINKTAAVANLQLAGLQVTGGNGVNNDGVTNTGSGVSSVSIGNLSITSGYRNIAIGNAAIAEGVNNIAIGKTANSSNTNAVAIGADTTAEHASSVALGSESKTTRTNEVSIGSDTLKRVLGNLAPGALGADAVTFDQLKQALASLADSGQLIKAGVLLPWPTNIAPPGCALAVGQAFDKVANPQLATVYPSGFLPDMRDRTILGTPIGRAPLSLADGEVKYHGHGGEVGGVDLGSKETTASGAYQLKLRSYRSNTALDGGDSNRHSFEQGLPFTDYGLIEPLPNHSHWVTLGWHGHSLRIDPYGAAKNTVDNIAFNYIVRLA